jgi:hypothetical protein
MMIPPMVGIAASVLFAVLSAITGVNKAFGLRSVLVVFTVGITFGIVAALHLKFMGINAGKERAKIP